MCSLRATRASWLRNLHTVELHSHARRGLLSYLIYLSHFLSSKLGDFTSCLRATGGFCLNSLELICLMCLSKLMGTKQPVIGILWLWERLSEDNAESCIEIWQPQRGSLSQRATACFSAENACPQRPLKVKVKLNVKQSFSSLGNKISRKKTFFLFSASSNIIFLSLPSLLSL